MHVVQAFIDAVNARDGDLVRHLSLNDSSRFTEWVENGWVLRDASISREIDGGYSEDVAVDPAKTEVLVTFDPSDADSSFEPGETTTWTFVLTYADERWVVSDSGTG